MAYNIKDHGVWRSYVPDPMPDWAKQVILSGHTPAFLKRESDGKDFYEYRNSGKHISNNSVVATTLFYQASNTEVVKSVFADQSMIFPVNQRLIEIFGVSKDETKPHNLFTEMEYDPKTNTLSGEPGIKITKVTLKKDLWARVTDDEADTIETWLSSQTTRQQRLFNDAITVDHGTEYYDSLLSAFSDLFGADRAEQILEMSK